MLDTLAGMNAYGTKLRLLEGLFILNYPLQMEFVTNIIYLTNGLCFFFQNVLDLDVPTYSFVLLDW